MNKKLLCVDKDVDNFNSRMDSWLKQKITPVRVSSMQEAIERIIGEDFDMIDINGDNINWKPIFPIMYDSVGRIPIRVFVSEHTFDDEIEALKIGVDYYAKWYPDSDASARLGEVMMRKYPEQCERAARYHKENPGVAEFLSTLNT